MTDSGLPVGTGGGPRFLRGRDAGAAQVDGPVALAGASAPTTFIGTQGVESNRPEELFANRYARSGSTPVPHMIVAVAALVGSWWAVQWAQWDSSAPGALHTSEWWTNVTAVLIPAEDVGTGAYSPFRMWVTLATLTFAALAVIVWIGRIGSNVRPGSAPFGSVLPALAFPAWWMLPITINATATDTRSRSDLMIRYLVAFAILFGQFLLLRWPTLNRIWRAGRLRYDLASIVLWLPMMIPWSMIMLSYAVTYLTMGEDGAFADSGWRPTQAMADWATWLTRASGIGLVLLLVVVTGRQHVGMHADYLDDQANRQR